MAPEPGSDGLRPPGRGAHPAGSGFALDVERTLEPREGEVQPASASRSDERRDGLAPAEDSAANAVVPVRRGPFVAAPPPVVDQRGRASLAVLRSSGGEFSAQELAVLELLSPHFADAAHGAGAAERALLPPGPGELPAQGFAILSPDGELEHGDGPALALLVDLRGADAPGALLRGGLAALASRDDAEVRLTAPARSGAFVELAFARLPALGERVALVLRELEPGSAAHVHAAAEAARLSPRERAVAALVARGLTNQQIACELGLSRDTVKEYLSSAYRKTGADGRAALTSYLLGGTPGASGSASRRAPR